MTTIQTTFINILKNATVASAASVEATEWNNYHVFNRYGGSNSMDPFSAGVNLGRGITVLLFTENAENEVVAQPNYINHRIATYTIRIITPVYTLRVDSQVSKIYNIKEAILKLLKDNPVLGHINIKTKDAIVINGSIFLDIEITTENVLDETYDE